MHSQLAAALDTMADRKLEDSPKQICEFSAAVDHQTMTTTTKTTEESTIEDQILTAGKRTPLSSALRSYQYVTSGFYKFLARFSGEFTMDSFWVGYWLTHSAYCSTIITVRLWSYKYINCRFPWYVIESPTKPTVTSGYGASLLGKGREDSDRE